MALHKSTRRLAIVTGSSRAQGGGVADVKPWLKQAWISFSPIGVPMDGRMLLRSGSR